MDKPKTGTINHSTASRRSNKTSASPPPQQWHDGEKNSIRAKVLQSMGAKGDDASSFASHRSPATAVKSVVQSSAGVHEKVADKSSIQQLFKAKRKIGAEVSKQNAGLSPSSNFNDEYEDSPLYTDAANFEELKENPPVEGKRAKSKRLDPETQKQMQQRKREYLIPKDRAAWLEHLAQLAKKKTQIEYLSDKELKKVIIRARPNLGPKKVTLTKDQDLPPAFSWNASQIAEWVSSIGFPEMKEAFTINHISGRRLVNVDATALNKMGLQDFNRIKTLAMKIRELLGLHTPNMLRAIMRINPYEKFLRSRVFNGRTYDAVTFASFCRKEGFNYPLLRLNKNALIPCTCEVRIIPIGQHEEDEEEDTFDEDISLRNAPTVEFLVRNTILRNKAVQSIIEDVIDSVYLPENLRKYGGGRVEKTVFSALEAAFDEMRPTSSQERLAFASGVADALLNEMTRTAEILNDIQELRNHVQKDITPERLDQLKKTAESFIEVVMPITSMLALGQLDLETLFKDEPIVQEFVSEVAETAERSVLEVIPDAINVVDDVISTALKKVNSMPGVLFTYDEEFLTEADKIDKEYYEYKAQELDKLLAGEEDDDEPPEKCGMDDTFVRKPANPAELEKMKEKRASLQKDNKEQATVGT